MKKKKVVLPSIILGILVLTLGIAYAVFSYQEESLRNSELITGDIYMYYNETSKTINISNLMPNEEYLETDYFEFKVSGKNTYNKKDIYYEIVLDNGEYEGTDLNRTIPIDSQLLKFKLVEVNGDLETEIFSDRTYSDITNKRIWVDTIGSDDGNYSKTYRLYVRIAEYTNICGGEVSDGCDYYINPSEENANLDWNKLYASIKVNVKGDLEEKSIETDASCFGYEIINVENPTVNPVMENQLIEEDIIFKCVTYLKASGMPLSSGSMSNFCKGEGTAVNGYTFQENLDNGDWFSDEFISEMLSLNILVQEGDTYKVNPQMTNQNELTSCVGYFSNNMDFSLSDGEDWESFCKGEGTSNNQTFQAYLENDIFTEHLAYLFDLRVILGIGTVNIHSYDENCGPDVIIPREINGLKVVTLKGLPGYNSTVAPVFGAIENVIISDNITEIGDRTFSYNQLRSVVIPNSVTTIGSSAFSYNQLRSVVIPNGVTTIETAAFSTNQLRSVEIPNSVTTIGSSAFEHNQLRSVEIPNSVTTIGSSAFEHNQLRSVEIPNSVTTIGSSAFKHNQLRSVEIPNSVITIGNHAFLSNQLKTVTIGSGIQYIDSSAFFRTSYSNPNLESITFTNKTCDEIKNIEASSMKAKKYFPWLNADSPYYQEGYKSTIIGTDGECSY